MEAYTCKHLKQQAGERLKNASYSPKKLILLYAAVLLGLSLVLSLLQFILDRGIGGTGGLSGIGTRAALETLQSLLQLANGLLLPFWQMGLIFAMLRTVRGQQVQPASLLEGFRHFGPVLRMNLLRWCIYFTGMLLGCQLGAVVYAMSPAAAPVYTLAEQMVSENITDPYALLTEEAVLELAQSMLPFILLGILLPLIPVFYRLRLMDYTLADRPERGAFGSLRVSLALTRRNCLKFAKLDLSFWWYFALELLAAAVCCGDVLLELCGVELGMTATAASFLFFALGLTCQLGLYVWKMDAVTATYALAYEALLPQPEEENRETTD